MAGWLAHSDVASHQLGNLNVGGQYIRLFLATGILGGFTTFSAFSLDTALLIERGRWTSALFYSTGSVVLSIAALFLGLAVMRA